MLCNVSDKSGAKHDMRCCTAKAQLSTGRGTGIGTTAALEPSDSTGRLGHRWPTSVFELLFHRLIYKLVYNYGMETSFSRLLDSSFIF